MEFLFSLVFTFSIFFLLLLVLFYKQQCSPVSNGPPGRTGLPVIGETLEFLSTAWRGNPKKFILDRMLKYSPECFKTSIVGQSMVFFCGPSGHKFLFSNEGKLVKVWWPDSLRKLFPDGLQTYDSEAASKLRKLLPQFLKPEGLQRHICTMDAITQTHFTSSWEGKDIFAFPLAKSYSFSVACRLFLSLEDPNHVAHLLEPFNLVASGIISIPIDLPGTTFNKAIRAAKSLKEEFAAIVKQKKIDLAMQRESPNKDLLTCLLSTADANGELVSDSVVAEAITGLLIAGHDGVSSVITLIIKYLAELPHIYDAVYTEQMEIVKGKKAGEFLNWEDIKKMKYSWNVACEVMRLVPPSPGIFREAMVDFSFAGFTIPKGWKLYWSAHSSHRNPQYFPNPDKFDPTRFEGSGPAPYTYVPFGGGPLMCPGREYARLVMLVFMHNAVKRYRWEMIVWDEQIRVSPFPVPTKGLPIRLIPHQMTMERKED